MRLLLVALFVAFALPNGVPAANLKTDINKILDNVINASKTAVDSLSAVDGGAGKKVLIDIFAAMDRAQQVVDKVLDDQGNIIGNISDLTDTVSYIEEIGPLVVNYIDIVMAKSGSTPGTKETLRQIIDTVIKTDQNLISLVKATGLPVPQVVYDALNTYIATMEKVKATIV